MRQGPAPSTDAASYSSVGTCLSPARKMTIGAPNCQTVSRMSIGIVRDGSPTQPPASKPKNCWTWSTMPLSMNIAFHTIAMETEAPISEGA